MKARTTTTRIFLLAGFSTLLCFLVTLFLFPMLVGDYNWPFILLANFSGFIIVLVLLYYFYFVDVSSRVNKLSAMIREKFSSNEIPRMPSQLEEEDCIERLRERVEEMIENREKEVVHFENLDSYRKEYLGNVSHELKTPVFNVQGYIDTLLNGGLEDPTINVEYLRRAEKSVDRLISIIDDLETITQLESGGLILDIDAFDIAALVKEIYASLELNAAKRNTKLELSKKYDKPVLVLADKFRIRQVIVNLVANSIKYGKDNGTTVIDISYLHDDVVISVSDNGDGIDEKHIPRVFERFYRVDKGRSREQGGTGLGLAIVKHIIEAHGKSIVAESRRGRGTRFTFSLPAVP
jgi:two-component system phosphate regulon sensor histidine kinase PhoR